MPIVTFRCRQCRLGPGPRLSVRFSWRGQERFIAALGETPTECVHRLLREHQDAGCDPRAEWRKGGQRELVTLHENAT